MINPDIIINAIDSIVKHSYEQKLTSYEQSLLHKIEMLESKIREMSVLLNAKTSKS